MRLLRWQVDDQDRYVLNFEEFFSENVPEYAILSHTWSKDEVLYTHIVEGTATVHDGYKKVTSAIQLAHDNGYAYIWIDTCCIDKSSSSELSEAINSMWTWYENANICYAYLEDVYCTAGIEADSSEFKQSRWFTRGWCLQELLAPKDVVFMSHDWCKIGSREELYHPIAVVTSIRPDVLFRETPVHAMSVAQRMSWAASRQTSRPEDIAYCLMGIFSVNMPLLYGEGSVKAFHRLQEEIMKASDDHSLFAWLDKSANEIDEHGLLADSPLHFESSGQLIPYEDWEHKNHYQMTNRGLLVDLHLHPFEKRFIIMNRRGAYLAALDCPSPQLDFTGYVGIMLHKLPGTERKQYKRIHCDKLFSGDERGKLETLYVRQKPIPGTSTAMLPLHYFSVGRQWFSKDYAVLDVVAGESPTLQFSRSSTESVSEPWIPSRFPSKFKIFKKANALSAAILMRRSLDGYQFVLMLGSISPIKVGFDLREWQFDQLSSFEDLDDMFDPVPMELYKCLDNFEMMVVTQCYCEESEKCYEVTMYLSLDSYPPLTPKQKVRLKSNFTDKAPEDHPVHEREGDTEEGNTGESDGRGGDSQLPFYNYEHTWLIRPI